MKIVAAVTNQPTSPTLRVKIGPPTLMKSRVCKIGLYFTPRLQNKEYTVYPALIKKEGAAAGPYLLTPLFQIGIVGSLVLLGKSCGQ